MLGKALHIPIQYHMFVDLPIVVGPSVYAQGSGGLHLPEGALRGHIMHGRQLSCPLYAAWARPCRKMCPDRGESMGRWVGMVIEGDKFQGNTEVCECVIVLLVGRVHICCITWDYPSYGVSVFNGFYVCCCAASFGFNQLKIMYTL